jgi:hypothetical protein
MPFPDGSNPVCPLFLQSPAVRAPDIDAGQSTSHRVKPSSQDQNIQIVLAGRGLDTAPGHLLDRRFTEIDGGHVGLIEDVKEVLLQGRPLCSIGVKRLRRCKNLGNRRIFDTRPRFVTPEIVGRAIRLLVDKKVVERANPRHKATNLPNAFERRSPLLFGHL